MAQFMPSPRTVDIALTGRCNLRCGYCFYADEMVSLNDLSTPIWLNALDELGQLGIMNVVLTGGEVFTRPDLFELIDGVIANRMRYSLLSNGTLITPQTIKQFEVGKRKIRLDGIQVSIDGSTSEIHNQSRPKSFDRAIRGLRLAKDAGLPVQVRVTLNKYNVHDLENIAELLLEDIGMPAMATNEAATLGAGCNNQNSIALTPQDMLFAMQTIERLMDRYPGRLLAQAGPQAKLRSYREMEHARQTGEQPTRWQMGYLTGCGCPFSKISILHDGTIVPCHILHGLSLGNIQTDSLLDIWTAHPILSALRERRAIPMQEVPGCSTCEWAPYCNGSCPGVPYELTGDFNIANPQDCYKRFLNAIGKHDAIQFS